MDAFLIIGVVGLMVLALRRWETYIAHPRFRK
jgi:hypothetical protein